MCWRASHACRNAPSTTFGAAVDASSRCDFASVVRSEKRARKYSSSERASANGTPGAGGRSDPIGGDVAGMTTSDYEWDNPVCLVWAESARLGVADRWLVIG